MFSEKAFREKLATAASAEDLLELFRAWEPAA